MTDTYACMGLSEGCITHDWSQKNIHYNNIYSMAYWLFAVLVTVLVLMWHCQSCQWKDAAPTATEGHIRTRLTRILSRCQCILSMFLEQFTDLLESYVACDRLFVVGDLNVHFDNPSDPCTAALNAVLANLSLEQLVNVPTHRRGHTLDWLITNCATDVLDLTVADMLLSDHFIISFDLLFRKPGRVTKKVTSRNIRSVDM